MKLVAFSGDGVLLPANSGGGFEGYADHDILPIRNAPLNSPAAICPRPAIEKVIRRCKLR